MIKRYGVVPDFFAGAAELRERLDAHFSTPFEQDELSHGVWNIWYVPELYNNFRADPRRLFGPLLDGFMAQLRRWSREHLGLSSVSAPSIHLYLNGCFQGLHSDAHNGVWGWVYSLTRWDQRTFKGGETLLLRDGALNYKRHQVDGDALYDLIPPRFNQLTLFDDRIVHAVQRLEGTLDPREARVVLNGHLFGGPPLVDGPLEPSAVRRVVSEGLEELAGRLRALRDVHGMISVRTPVSPDGRAGTPSVLFNNIVTSQEKQAAVEVATAETLDCLGALRYPAAAAPSVVTLPVLVPVRRPHLIRLERQHALGGEQALARVAQALDHLRFNGGLDGAWSGQHFELVAPGPGAVEVTGTHVRCELELCMITPNQAEAFERELVRWLERALTAPKG